MYYAVFQKHLKFIKLKILFACICNIQKREEISESLAGEVTIYVHIPGLAD